MIKKTFISLLFCLATLFSWSQDPAHFVLGQEQLSGKDIYTMLQDKFGNYWVGTNYGIYKFDGYEFKFIDCAEMLSPSVFNLKEDSQGRIYCHNLGGQIFQIENDVCIVYCQLPDNIVKNVLDYSLDKNDNLYFESKNVYQVDKETRSIKIVYTDSTRNLGKRMLTDNEGTIHYFKHIKENNSSAFLDITIINGETETKRYLVPEGLPALGPFQSFEKNDSILIFSERQKSFYYFKEDSLCFLNKFEQHTPQTKLLYTGEIWISDLSTNIFQLDDSYNLISKSYGILNSYIISCAIKDNEENTLFGTFNNGIVVVPKTNIYDINVNSEDGFVSRLATGPNKTLFYTTNNGTIVQLKHNKEINRFNTNKPSRIEFIHYLPFTNELLISQGASFTINLETRKTKPVEYSALKSINEIYPNEYLLSTNVGVHYKNYGEDNKFENNSNIKSTYVYNNRSTSSCYDSLYNILYLGTATGLLTKKDEKIQDIKLRDVTVYANDMVYHDGAVYITTNKNGLLVFENGKLVDNWHENRNETSSKFRHVKVWNNHFIISTERGVRIFDKNGETKALINESEGLYSNQINDFEIVNDTLWMLHQKGVQIISLSSFKPSKYTPPINIKEILINDIPRDPENAVNLEYNQNKITFLVSALSMRYIDDIVYQYRLVGVDEDWQRNIYTENRISYKTLPPNKYTFEVQAIYNGNRSEMKSFSFEIHPAYWNTWLFRIFLIAVILSIFSLLLVYFIRRQKKKVHYKNEINGLKLTAIQAQMNPHFIFNSLNSIQDLVLKNDAENAYSYISKFALLVRNTLNHSKKDFINLETEVESLDLYLTLEELRFKQNFDYTIINEIDDQVIIPPLLIQPFIENAIVHGLIHKKGHKQVDITFTYENGLVCTIKDNGIGRYESRIINLRQRKDHESFAVEAIKKRLEILEEHYGGTFEITYEDISTHREIGTVVRMRLPYKFAY